MLPQKRSTQTREQPREHHYHPFKRAARAAALAVKVTVFQDAPENISHVESSPDKLP